MGMTNQEKLTAIFNLTGPTLYEAILQAVGPGKVHFTKDAEAARRETRNTAIKAEYYDFPNDMTDQEIYRILGKRHKLAPDTIRKIIKTKSGSR